MTNDNRHCHNNHCPSRDDCRWANAWTEEKQVFFGDEKDCQEFEKKSYD